MSFNSTFEKDGVIPDVLPTLVTIKFSIKAEWPNATLSFPGQTLDRQATQPEPKLTLEPPPSLDEDVEAMYTLIVTDPDLTKKNDDRAGQVRHWLATHVKINRTGEVDLTAANQLSPWVGPAPMPVVTG